MKDAFHPLLLIALLLAGCGRGNDPTAPDARPSQRVRAESMRQSETESDDVAWDPSLFEGGYMFPDTGSFHRYVRRGEIIASGMLLDWDGTKGEVQVESVHHGKLNKKTVSLVSSGGFAPSKTGDKVLFLLSQRNGQLKLHSFCGASGLYNYSDHLVSRIEESAKLAK